MEEEGLLNLEDDEETTILAAVSTYMRRDLNRSEGFFENILPRYSLATSGWLERPWKLSAGKFKPLEEFLNVTLMEGLQFPSKNKFWHLYGLLPTRK